jgi:hypothetical protein
MPGRIPSRDELRVGILWCARMLVSYDGKPFGGPVRVSVCQPEEREAKVIKPKGTTEGMEPPGWVALGEEGELGASVSEVLRVLLSPDEEKLLVALASRQPCTATTIHDACKATLSKSDFWAVWGQLQKREIVQQGDDDKYRVGPEWLVAWLKVKREGGRPAA